MTTKCKHSGIETVITELGTYYICQSCHQLFVSQKRKLINLWIAQRFYQGRGAVYTGQIRSLLNAVTTGGIILLLLQAVWGEMPPLWILPLLWLVQTVSETLIGFRDFKKWKIAQNEGGFGLQYAPLTVELIRRLKNIEKVVNPEDYRDESVVDGKTSISIKH